MKKRLEKNKKRMVIIGSIPIILGGIISLNIYHTKEYKKIEETKEMAFFIKEESSSDYTKVNNIPATGYSLNASKSACSNGAIPSWSNGVLTLNNLRNKNTSCYLYFDKIKNLSNVSELITSLNITDQTDSVPNFASAATTNEGVFKTTDVMYGGDTYYWRGAVDNNHVIFADLCWKMIRINGDGSIRLIYNGAPENGVCKQASDETSLAVTSQSYNASHDKSYYVGWTYETGKQRPTNNLTASPSNIQSQTDTWYKINITDKGYDEKVATGKFCNDRSTSFLWSEDGGTYFYTGYDRRAGTPTTSCPEGDVYEMKAGAITSDEVIMAGSGKYETENNDYFLYNGQYYWTMTPFLWYCCGPLARVFAVFNDGQLNAEGVNSAIQNIRPVINLLPSTTFKPGGNGTANTPYIVS